MSKLQKLVLPFLLGLTLLAYINLIIPPRNLDFNLSVVGFLLILWLFVITIVNLIIKNLKISCLLTSFLILLLILNSLHQYIFLALSIGGGVLVYLISFQIKHKKPQPVTKTILKLKRL